MCLNLAMSADQKTPPSQTTIAFLSYREFDAGEAYRGAILITDEWSKPLEFRCTAPVRPTQLQRTLYGKSLLPHILTELIGSPLIASVRETPHLILITDEAYFEVRHKTTSPVIRVTKSGTAKSKGLLLQSSSGKFDQLEIQAHGKFSTDLDSSGDRLRDLFARWDLAEPFQRMGEGLQYVHDERVLES
jgi:hypothetical protein